MTRRRFGSCSLWASALQGGCFKEGKTVIEIRPMSIHIGAEIHGVDLTQPLAPETVQEIRTALLQWKVVFFRDQHLNHQ
jgi:hypothetical protein